jgi:hypothetical protein
MRSPADFEFDCPSNYFPLSSSSVGSYDNSYFDPWFLVSHANHEIWNNSNHDNIYDAAISDAVVVGNTSMVAVGEQRSIGAPRRQCATSSDVQIAKVSSKAPHKVPSAACKKLQNKSTASVATVPITAVISHSQSDQRGAKAAIPSKRPFSGTAAISTAAAAQSSPRTRTTTMSSSTVVVGKPVKSSLAIAAFAGAGNAATSKKRPLSSVDDSGSSSKLSNDDLLKKLRAHNDRFVAPSTYEPPRHSVREVRQWEKITGKTWSSLKPDEREKANQEIADMKVSNSLFTSGEKAH